MRRKSFADMNCSVARALDVVGDPWTLLIVRDLLRGYRRFEVIQRRLGIPRNTLTTRLQTLVDQEIVVRRRYQEHPDRFEYALTPKGLALRPVVITLMSWGDEWSGIGQPPVILVERSTRDRLAPALVDRRTGELLDDLDYDAVDAD